MAVSGLETLNSWRMRSHFDCLSIIVFRAAAVFHYRPTEVGGLCLRVWVRVAVRVGVRVRLSKVFGHSVMINKLFRLRLW